MALWTGRIPFKLAVAGSCAIILFGCMCRGPWLSRLQLRWVVAAFAMSMAGDYFLSSRNGHAHYFEAGIAAFFAAHLGFLRYALAHGRTNTGALAAMLFVFVPYFVLGLSPAIESRTLWSAVLLYLLVSCIGLAAALGLKQPRPVKWLYVAGIALIVFSDTLISFGEFLHYRRFNFLILPTYYAAHLAITASILARPELRCIFTGPTDDNAPAS
ncbi:MAG: lysoplasmalogenase [Verrucomicrobiota bacterium]|nr:lysoplasmalogenase [Verrucomicrobiota bacterium]